MSEPYTVGRLKQALEAFDDDLPVMVPGDEDCDYMWFEAIRLRGPGEGVT